MFYSSLLALKYIGVNVSVSISAEVFLLYHAANVVCRNEGFTVANNELVLKMFLQNLSCHYYREKTDVQSSLAMLLIHHRRAEETP